MGRFVLLLEHLAVRKTNDFGKTDAERDLMSLDEVVDALEHIADTLTGR